MPLAVGTVVVFLPIESPTVATPWVAFVGHLDALDELPVSAVVSRENEGHFVQLGRREQSVSSFVLVPQGSG